MSDCDVLVIGAGVSGSVVTHTLSKAGYKVICLEQGDWVNPSDFATNQPEWELLIQEQWSHDPNVRKLRSDYPLDNSDSDMTPVLYNAVGGSSIYFGAQWPRLFPSDFRVKSLDGVADDWPISYNELKPYYDEVDEFIGAAGMDDDTAYPEGLRYPMPPHPLGPLGRKCAEAANKLGWHWWPGANAIPTAKHMALEQCARFGVCEWGCPHGAKASFDQAYMVHAQKLGAQIITGARVSEINVDENGRAVGATYLDRNHAEHTVLAKAVVLCANGVGTARLLLLSKSNKHKNGLANSSGLVGKNLMLHPTNGVVGFYEEDLQSNLGPAGQPVVSFEFYETDKSRGFVRGAKFQAMPTPGPLNAIEFHRSLPYDELWGENAHKIARRAQHGLLWSSVTEDLPREENCVTLSEIEFDDSGLPAAKINYRITDDNEARLNFMVDRMEELHKAGGAIQTFAIPLWIDQPGHLLGTARMGDDPTKSVTDSWGRTHDVDNLFIADGSLFVTSGGVNPTSTISALALRVARGIVEFGLENPK